MNPKTLYQLNQRNKIKIWKIWVEEDLNYSAIMVESGLQDGKHIINQIPVYEGKNLGKINETTHYTQACTEAQSRIESQIRSGYVDDITKVTASDILGSGIKSPMLAEKYHPTGKQKGSKTLQQMKLEGETIYVEPKFDGNRCEVEIDQGKACMFTRAGDVMPVQLDHILDELLISYGCNSNVNGKIDLDGELYTDKMSFNSLNGILKNESPNAKELEARLDVKLYLYDIMVDKGYRERYEMIKPFASDHVEITEVQEIIATDENIKFWQEYWLERGYEGLMIRRLDKGYENKRTWQLVKCKIFEDEEFKLIGFEEDVRGGFVGKFKMELPEPTKDRYGKIITDFGAGASGQTVKERTSMWQNPQKFLGRMATVEFFGRSEYGVPRFAKFKGLRSCGRN